MCVCMCVCVCLPVCLSVCLLLLLLYILIQLATVAHHQHFLLSSGRASVFDALDMSQVTNAHDNGSRCGELEALNAMQVEHSGEYGPTLIFQQRHQTNALGKDLLKFGNVLAVIGIEQFLLGLGRSGHHR